MKEKYIEEDAI